jgi:cephalosporin-C deacetylase
VAVANLVNATTGQGWELLTAAAFIAMALPWRSSSRGIHDPEGYYYRRLVVDAVRAVDCLRTHPAVDAGRVMVAGASQGGGLALATAALAGEVAAVMPDMPFPCHWRRATRLADRGPYAEVARYCAAQRDRRHSVFATLGYFDAVSFAARCRAPALFSVALMDRVCPPSTVYAAYNHYAGPKRLAVWEYNDHEGGGPHQQQLQLDFLSCVLTCRCQALSEACRRATGLSGVARWRARPGPESRRGCCR